MPVGPSENYFKDVNSENSAYWQEQQEAIRDAKDAAGNSKEEFKVNEFIKHYSLADLDGVQDTSKEMVRSLEVEYYLDHPDITTLDEFAQLKISIDSQPNR